MNATDYTAHIIANPDDDELTPVDLRTLPESRLLALRDEAGMAGDREMVHMIGEVMGQRQYWPADDFFTDYFPHATYEELQHFADMLEGRAGSFAKMKATPGTQAWLDEWAATTTRTRQAYHSQVPTYADIDDVRLWLAHELGEDDE